MIYLGNGMYSDSGSQDELMHYGVLGMKWGVRKARNVANEMDRMHRDGVHARLRAMYKNGQISKEQYRKAKRKMRAAYKAGKADNEQNARRMQAMLREGIKSGKTKGIKARTIRDAAIKSADKQMPGFANMHKANQRLSTSQALFGVVGAAAYTGSWTKAYKDFSSKNQGTFDRSAREYASQPKQQSYRLTGSEEAEAWKKIAKQYQR